MWINSHAALVDQHYNYNGLTAKILSLLKDAGKNVDALQREDLSAFDEFHAGGIFATRSLAVLAGLRQGMHVLDVGSGLGGPARTLAAEFGCRVLGLDVTEEFCRAARELTGRVGLADKVVFQQGDALNMPFEEGAFDAVWTQFVGMNIRDKERLYAQFYRVLRPGGLFAFHEVMAGENDDIHFPVLWANDPSISFLRKPEDIRRLLASTGFQEVAWKDLTQRSFEWFQGIKNAPKKAGGPPTLGFQVFILDSAQQKAGNILRNLEENRISVIQAALRKV